EEAAARLAAAAGERATSDTTVAPASLGLEHYEHLAKDLTLAYDSGDAAALERISAHYGRTVTGDDVRAGVWQAVRTVREASGRPGSFPVAAAQELIAREAGSSNWTAFASALTIGTPPPGQPSGIN